MPTEEQPLDLDRLTPEETRRLARALHREKSALEKRLAESAGPRPKAAGDASKTVFEKAFEALPAHAAILDPEGVILAVNRAWLTFAEANGPVSLDAIGPGANYLAECRRAARADEGEAAAVLAGLEALQRGQIPRFALEYPCDSPTERRWFAMTAMPLGETPPHGLLVTHLDISASKRGEESLRSRERWFRALTEKASEDILLLDAKGRIFYESPHEHPLLGYDPGEMNGRASLELLHPEDLTKTRAAFKRLVQRVGASHQQEVRLRRKEGGWSWVRLRATNLLADPAVGAIVVNLHDITASREAQAALRASEERLRQSVRVARLGHFEHDHLSGEVYFSPVMRELWGWEQEEAATLDRTIAAIHADDRERFVAAMRRAHDPQGDGLFFSEHRVVRPDGSVCWVHARSQTSFAGAGAERTAVRTVGAVVDVSVAKEAEARLRELTTTLEHQVEQRTHALRESEARFRKIYEHAGTGIAITDTHHIVQCNPAFARLIGYGEEELREIPFSKLLHPDDRAHNLRLTRRLQRGAITSFEIDNRYVNKAGEAVWVHKFVTLLDDEPEPGANLIALVTDITKRREIEQRLRQLSQAVEHSPASVIITDPEGTIEYVNPAFTRVTGYRLEEAVGRNPRILKTNHTPPEDYVRLWRTLLAGKIWRGEFLNRRKNGESFWERASISPLTDDHGQITHFVAVKEDVTDEKLAQEALRRSEEALATFFSEAPVGLLWVDPAGRVMRVNRAFLEFLGCSAEEVLGQPVTAFDAGGDIAVLFPLPEADDEPIRNHRARLRCGESTSVHALLDIAPVREGGRLVRSDWFVRDITRRVELEHELMQVSDRERQQIGHELHDDLSQILHGAHFLTAELQNRLSAAGRPEAGELGRIVGILDDALATTRSLSRGLQPVAAVPEGLMNALRDHAARIRQVYGLSCRFMCPQPVHVDDPVVATHLFRIAQEAINNAVRHAQCRRITIRLQDAGERLLLAIRDDGHGRIPPSSRRRGIGLHVMQFRASAVNGSLAIQNRRDKGTEVVCSVQRAPPSAPRPSLPPTA